MVIFYDKNGIVWGNLEGENEGGTSIESCITLEVSEDLAVDLRSGTLSINDLRVENGVPKITKTDSAG